jgi:hypothetical protein
LLKLLRADEEKSATLKYLSSLIDRLRTSEQIIIPLVEAEPDGICHNAVAQYQFSGTRVAGGTTPFQLIPDFLEYCDDAPIADGLVDLLVAAISNVGIGVPHAAIALLHGL